MTRQQPPRPNTESLIAKVERNGVERPQKGDEPEASATLDEHRGLAAKIIELRNTVELHRQMAVRDLAELRQRTAQVTQDLDALRKGVDTAIEKIQQMQRDLEAALREGGDQVRKAGELARKMSDQVKELEELREMAADPHEVIKPLQRGLALVRGDLEALGKNIDGRFEQLPKPKSKPWEERAAEEDPVVKMGAEVRKLRQRLQALEDEKARA